MEIEQFKKLLLPLHKQLYQTAYLFLRNREDAEDLIQEAYLKLWNKREEVVIQTNPPAYCHMLVRRMCIDLLRQQQNRHDADELENLHLSTEENPEQFMVVKDGCLHLKQLIRQLPDTQSRVMWMRDVCGCSFEEIEKVTGMNAVNIRSALSRARKKIREQLKKLMK